MITPPLPFLTFDKICKLLGVRTPDAWLEDFDRYDCFPWDPEATEEENQNAEEEMRDEQYTAYQDAVMQTAEDVFGYHHLTLVPRWGTYRTKDEKGKTKRVRYVKDYRIQPTRGKTWSDAADEIRMTINGVGYFEFNSLGEFKRSGPYTARGAALCHLGWVPDWYAVYEGGKAESRVNARLR